MCVIRAFIILISVAMVTVSLVEALDDDCGTGPPVGNCAGDCYKTCVTGLQGVVDPYIKETIIFDKNICILHCQAMVYKPQMKYAPKRRPHYSDVENCLFPCDYPMSKYCREGYIGMFFYCDCYQCCAFKSPANAELCIAGCHEWFMKRYSSTGVDICRFKPEYAKTPIHWCQAYCTWKIMRTYEFNYTMFESVLNNRAIDCTTKCVAALHNDIPVDYDTVLTQCQTNRHQCVTDVTVHGFNITTTNLSYAAILSSPVSSRIIIFKNDSHSNTSPAMERVQTNVTFKTTKHAIMYKTTRPVGLENMFKQGVRIVVDSNIAGRVDMSSVNSNIATEITQRDIGIALRDAFNFTHGTLSHRASMDAIINLDRVYDVDGCTHFSQSGYANVVHFTVNYEADVTITDHGGVVPMKAEDLKKAMAAKSDWGEGMEFAGIVDPYTIAMKAKSSFHLEIAVSPEVDIECDIIPNCNSLTRNNQNPCRCFVTSGTTC